MSTARPVGCCGKCPPILGGGYDCTCEGNPRCKNGGVGWRERLRARKVQRLRDRRDDYWDWLWYARLSLRPSQVRRADEHLAKLDARLAAAIDSLTANSEPTERESEP